jgi:hypothetical protein
MLGCSSLDAYELSSFASRMSWFAGSPASDQFRLGGRDPLSKPATLRSSSASGQWIPSPSPSSSQRCRCSSEALSSRGNHSNGTASLRPSARSTRSSCSVTSTCLAKGRTSTVEVCIPALQEFCPILLNSLRNPVNSWLAKPVDQASLTGPTRTSPVCAPVERGRAVVRSLRCYRSRTGKGQSA